MIIRACLINAEKKKLNNPASSLMKFVLVNLKSYRIGDDHDDDDIL